MTDRSRATSYADVGGLTELLEVHVRTPEPFPDLPKNEPQTVVMQMLAFWEELHSRQDNFSVSLRCVREAFHNVFKDKRETLGLPLEWDLSAQKKFKTHCAYLANVGKRKKHPRWFKYITGERKRWSLDDNTPQKEDAGDEVAEEEEHEADGEEEDGEEGEVDDNDGQHEEDQGDESERETCGPEQGWFVDFDFSRKVATCSRDFEDSEVATVDKIECAPGNGSCDRPARVRWSDGTWSKLPMLTGSELVLLKESVSRTTSKKPAATSKKPAAAAMQPPAKKVDDADLTPEELGVYNGESVKLFFRRGSRAGERGATIEVGGKQKLQVLAHSVAPECDENNLVGAGAVAKQVAAKLLDGSISISDLKTAKDGILSELKKLQRTDATTTPKPVPPSCMKRPAAAAAASGSKKPRVEAGGDSIGGDPPAVNMQPPSPPPSPV